MKSLLFLLSFIAAPSSLVVAETEFGRSTTLFRTSPRIARKRTYFAKGTYDGAQESHARLMASKSTIFANQESDRWLLGWSELSLSFSFNNTALPTHRPTAGSPVTKAPTNSRPTNAPTNPSPRVPTKIPTCAPSVTKSNNIPHSGCSLSFSDYPSMEPSNHPSRLPSHALSTPSRPISSPTQLRTFTPTAGLIPIGMPKTLSPTRLDPGRIFSPAQKTSSPTANSTGPVASSSSAIFECTTNGIVSLPTNSSNTTNVTTTKVQISVTYTVESKNGTSFLDELPYSLLQTAVNASLNCHASGRRLVRSTSVNRQLAISTTIIGRCTPTLKNATCYILQTVLTYILNESVEAEYSAYVAYLAIRDGMERGLYVMQVPSLLQLKYLSPSPTFPNPSGVSSPSISPTSNSLTHGTSISSWTMGACITVSAVGLLALLVWGRNRWTRHRRHILLLEEEISLELPSLIIPEDDKL